MLNSILCCITEPKQKKTQTKNQDVWQVAPSDGKAAITPSYSSQQTKYDTAPRAKELSNDGSVENLRQNRTATTQHEDRLSNDGRSQPVRSNFSWADSAGRRMEGSTSQSAFTFHPSDIQWSKKEIKQCRCFAFRHINLQETAANMKSWHMFDYDYSKNFNDPLQERPGIDFVIEPKFKVEAAKITDPSQVCEFGKKQTPIDLSSQMEVLKGFQDKEFQFNYDTLESVQQQLKFNETADQFIYDIARGKFEKDNNNFMKTSTISLFDSHIPVATLHGAQFHFHAPSEHSIDGKLLDLEMHIVHLMDNKEE